MQADGLVELRRRVPGDAVMHDLLDLLAGAGREENRDGHAEQGLLVAEHLDAGRVGVDDEPVHGHGDGLLRLLEQDAVARVVLRDPAVVPRAHRAVPPKAEAQGSGEQPRSGADDPEVAAPELGERLAPVHLDHDGPADLRNAAGGGEHAVPAAVGELARGARSGERRRGERGPVGCGQAEGGPRLAPPLGCDDEDPAGFRDDDEEALTGDRVCPGEEISERPARVDDQQDGSRGGPRLLEHGLGDRERQ